MEPVHKSAKSSRSHITLWSGKRGSLVIAALADPCPITLSGTKVRIKAGRARRQRRTRDPQYKRSPRRTGAVLPVYPCSQTYATPGATLSCLVGERQQRDGSGGPTIETANSVAEPPVPEAEIPFISGFHAGLSLGVAVQMLRAVRKLVRHGAAGRTVQSRISWDLPHILLGVRLNSYAAAQQTASNWTECAEGVCCELTCKCDAQSPSLILALM